MKLLLAALLLLDASGAAPVESPLVGYAIDLGGGNKGPTEAGVLDARTGAILWRERFEKHAWPRACGNLLLVTEAIGERQYETRAFILATGAPRFRREGSLYETPAAGGRRLVVFRGQERLAAVDPSTGAEAWKIAVPADGWPRFLADGKTLILHSNKRYAAYSVQDGGPLWEMPRTGSDQLSFSGGRLWSFKPGQTRATELDPKSGREREGPEFGTPIRSVIEQKDVVDFVLERSVARFRADDLSRVWTAELPEPVSGGWGDARTIVLNGAGDPEVLLLVDTASGRLLANEPLERMQSGSSSIRLNHPRYLLKSIQPSGKPTVLRIFDRRDGRLALKEELDDYEDGWKDGFILLRRRDALHAVDVATGSGAWTAPIEGIWKDTERRCGRILIATSRSITAIDAVTGRECWKRDFGTEVGNVTLTPAAAR